MVALTRGTGPPAHGGAHARPEASGWPLLAMAHAQQQKHHEWLKGELSICIFLVLST